MSDIERVLQSEFHNPDAVKFLVAGAVPSGAAEGFDPAPERGAYESFTEGAVRVVDPVAHTRVEDDDEVQPVRRKPGRPKKNIQTESGES